MKMGLGYDILTNYTQVAGTYGSRKCLEKIGFIPLDENKYYYAKVTKDNFLQIWRTMGDAPPDEDHLCTPIFGTKNWNYDNEYTKPFNKKLEELFKSFE